MPRGILNIGGISNLTVLPERGSDDEVLGFDCGPGNVLMDAWIEKVNHVRYDQDAVWARSGKVIPQLLESLKQEKFFLWCLRRARDGNFSTCLGWKPD